jgi:hypothetical protein
MVWSNVIKGGMVCWGLMWLCGPLHAEVSSFEDVNLPPDSFWNGADGSGFLPSGPVSFLNNYNTEFLSWDGFAASSMDDPNVRGWPGQYHAMTGSGVLGSPTYGVIYRGFVTPPTIVLNEPAVVQGLYVTNNTYAYYAMLEGDMVSKKFGGADGNEPDWFKLTITGQDAHDAPVGTVEFYLADYRFEDNALDTIIDEWSFVDLSSLGEVTSLVLDFSSSDNGDWGMNTPAYAAVDNLVLAGSEPYLEPGVPGFDPLDAARIHPIFRGWATDWVAYEPGPVADAYADPARALGEVTGDNLDVVSLGEFDAEAIGAGVAPGQITLVFGDPDDPNDERHIRNGTGDDFVIFENGFISAWNVPDFGSVAGQLTAELAYVEVSSNGVDFVRFPSLCLLDRVVGPYGTLDPNRIRHLAGGHANAFADSWGTPFDLDVLCHSQAVIAGRVDLQDIRFVRLVDIPGNGSSVDSTGHPIYDPWPTHGSAGFDLEAVGVLHAQTYVADINRDGVVDAADQDLLERHMGRAFGRDGWLARSDLNGDWRTDARDLAILTAQLGSVEPWRPASGSN